MTRKSFRDELKRLIKWISAEFHVNKKVWSSGGFTYSEIFFLVFVIFGVRFWIILFLLEAVQFLVIRINILMFLFTFNFKNNVC